MLADVLHFGSCQLESALLSLAVACALRTWIGNESNIPAVSTALFTDVNKLWRSVFFFRPCRGSSDDRSVGQCGRFASQGSQAASRQGLDRAARARLRRGHPLG